MNLVTIEQVSKQYSERLLLDRVNLLINTEDRIGLVGLNGTGKTTLLRLVSGQESPDDGRLVVWGGTRVHYLLQEPVLDDSLTVLEQVFATDLPELGLLKDYQHTLWLLGETPDNPGLQEQLAHYAAELDRTDGWRTEARVKATLTRLGITRFDARIGTLSGGERKRVALAQVLIDPGDLLILDEPTNHIDADTIAWLEEELRALPAALLMVTHDRYFLDRVANKIVELDRRELVTYPGNYSAYLEQRATRAAQFAVTEEKRQGILRRELEWLRRSPMARGTKQKARKQRVEELLQIRYDSGEDQVSMALASRRLGKRVLQAAGISKTYDGTSVLSNAAFRLEPGDRIGINGPNGAGKSTLLDILAGVTQPDSGSVEWGETVQLAYFDQQSENLPGHMRVLDYIDSIAAVIRKPDGERVDAPQMLDWFLFTRPAQRSYIHTLSGGERRRLYLLGVLAQSPNVLLLDEPTNDLDIQTLVVVEEFLDHFKGSLVVVSHDRYFLDRNVDFIVHVENGQVSGRYPAPFETFQSLRDASSNPSQGEAATTRPARQRGEGERKPAMTWRQRQEYTLLEANIAALEAQKADLEAEMESAGDDYARLHALSEKLTGVLHRLEDDMGRWFELAALAEEIEKDGASG